MLSKVKRGVKGQLWDDSLDEDGHLQALDDQRNAAKPSKLASPQFASTPEPLSDIFSDSPPASPTSKQPSEPSDIPRLRSTHATNGYRDGISASKDQALQPGFDEAYPLGAILGLRVGYVLGVLEGLCLKKLSPQALSEKVEVRWRQ
ncbi:MAG: hypothetical protein Q9177_004326 [Variospora cf. flavescens]